jgi:hypothetical protein
MKPSDTISIFSSLILLLTAMSGGIQATASPSRPSTSNEVVLSGDRETATLPCILDQIYNFELAMLPKHSQLRHDVERGKADLPISPRVLRIFNCPGVAKSWQADVDNDLEHYYFTSGVKTEVIS